jgi:hypothetical protein
MEQIKSTLQRSEPDNSISYLSEFSLLADKCNSKLDMRLDMPIIHPILERAGRRVQTKIEKKGFQTK